VLLLNCKLKEHDSHERLPNTFPIIWQTAIITKVHVLHNGKRKNYKCAYHKVLLLNCKLKECYTHEHVRLPNTFPIIWETAIVTKVHVLHNGKRENAKVLTRKMLPLNCKLKEHNTHEHAYPTLSNYKTNCNYKLKHMRCKTKVMKCKMFTEHELLMTFEL